MAARTRALQALESTEHEVLEYSPSQDHFGQHSVDELGLDADAVLKTLVVDDGSGTLALCCVPVSAHLSLKLAAKALGWKRARMADPARAQRATGYVVGGISPLGTLTKLPTLIDASATDFPTVTVSAGQRGLSARLDPQELARLAGARFVALSAE
ncbi:MULTISPECIES: aminoacyl-tRNA deacylase [unclassified Corynebacterium]|uniref:aminoacyl-tRNA deacylase n=1 Tax=unclassified Corynebacterium TaxID=2624378 RepID=UPI002A90C334|nr:aminoacyl-tRNA deacylase [Corynebacterium sp.]MDY5786375.1 aminoacyl-tRNA deacylase [Corynebacterium sp.]